MNLLTNNLTKNPRKDYHHYSMDKRKPEEDEDKLRSHSVISNSSFSTESTVPFSKHPSQNKFISKIPKPKPHRHHDRIQKAGLQIVSNPPPRLTQPSPHNNRHNVHNTNNANNHQSNSNIGGNSSNTGIGSNYVSLHRGPAAYSKENLNIGAGNKANKVNYSNRKPFPIKYDQSPYVKVLPQFNKSRIPKPKKSVFKYLNKSMIE
jgi:hypothetical protein